MRAIPGLVALAVAGLLMTLLLGCDKIAGGKACSLTPAGGSLIRPTCNYSCPNGSSFSLPGPVCSIVAPYPKR